MQKVSAKEHYDLLVQEGNDPANDPPILQAYMDQWDGKPFLDALALSPKSNVLEVGVGTGRLAKKVLEAGCGYFTGIDISPASITRAKENLRQWNNVYLLDGDFLTYRLIRPFNLIYCSLTLFHFQDKKAFVQKAAELLHTGRLVLSIPKQKETSIQFGSREVALYPDDLDTLINLFPAAGLIPSDQINTTFAHILVAKKL